MSLEYLGEKANVFPLSLALEEEGFGLVGGEMSVATGEEGLAGDFGAVATEGEHWFGQRTQRRLRQWRVGATG